MDVSFFLMDKKVAKYLNIYILTVILETLRHTLIKDQRADYTLFTNFAIVLYTQCNLVSMEMA